MSNIEIELDAALREQVAKLEGKLPDEVEVRSFGKVTFDPQTGVRRYFWKNKHIVTMSHRGDIKREVLVA